MADLFHFFGCHQYYWFILKCLKIKDQLSINYLMSKHCSLLPPMYGISLWSDVRTCVRWEVSCLKMAGSTLARLCSDIVLGHSGMSRQNSAAVSSKATLSMVALSRSTFADWLPFLRTCNQIIWRTCKFGHWLSEITKSLIVKPKSIASHTRKAAETPMITWKRWC